jgi:methylmalonyl-CoA mutase
VETPARKKWAQLAAQESGDDTLESLVFQSPEGISIKTAYGPDDRPESCVTGSLPGLPPYGRGPRATMYTVKPWTIRQYAGFSTARESNTFYKKCLSMGQRGLSVAFDLATHRGYDSDHPRVTSDVGKAGVAIDSVEDMKDLFEGIPLDSMSVSMTMNGAVVPILASFIVAAEESGIAPDRLTGTIQNDILKEYMVRNTYIYPPKPSMRIVGDCIEYLSRYLPRFNSISVSGYHLQEAGADSALELAYTLADGLEYIKVALARGLKIDDFAPRMSFFFGIGMNFLTEVAKLRAARTLWHEIVQTFQPQNSKSSLLRTHCQTSGYSLTEQDPLNNIVRTTVEAMAAVLGGTQSLHTNAFDEAVALPSVASARIARNTQLILQKETDITKTVDPFGGSYFMESLTASMIARARDIIDNIEKIGGMAAAVEQGIPMLAIESAAAAKQARIDSGEEVIVGVNAFKSAETQDFDFLEVDNSKVLATQLASLKALKQNRDQKKVEASLEALQRAAKAPDKNLLEYAIPAVKARATIGEISQTLAAVFGRHQANIQTLTAVYKTHYRGDDLFEKARVMVLEFKKTDGRPPRILVAKLGQDGHDRGSKVIASGLSDLGFDVDLGSLFQTPEEAAKQAVENDVHVIGVSTQAGAHKTLLPRLEECLRGLGADDIMIVAGGVIPKKDHQVLHDHGVVEIFGPGTPITDCAVRIIEALRRKKA